MDVFEFEDYEQIGEIQSELPSASILDVCKKRRLWRDCSDVQARLSLCWSHIQYILKLSCTGQLYFLFWNRDCAT